MIKKIISQIILLTLTTTMLIGGTAVKTKEISPSNISDISVEYFDAEEEDQRVLDEISKKSREDGEV
ncbi:hypothetical protein BH721_00920 [Clostridium baratii]|uniref:hypothetical protein n=1 Tax=Clostridium baratii TaxID=1561 RepID=UPI0009A347C3|nr:hypothetical protein [Clostridium baratii]OPF51626.1 hypothetical protein A1M12_03555 [Clostridium baratii]OPF55302.1 hypothetical protein BH721_00920 [Clostridium baratii]OPF57585.1 hypothetical protein BH724_08175 [Clostridium baratii]OPF60317.1 hypothetical protein BH725_07005 [Clostridium baratii]